MAVDTTGPGYLAGEYPGGTTTIEGSAVSAEVRVFYEVPSGDWQFVGSAISTSSGTWQLLNVNPDYTFHVLGRLAGYNDVVVSKVTPTRTDLVTASGEFLPNPTFNGATGSVFLVGGIPPYSVSVIAALPTGLSPVLDGRKLVIDGTSSSSGDWSSAVRVTSSNSAFVDISVKLAIGLTAPVSVLATVKPGGVTLNWTGGSSFAEDLLVYRSTSPISTGSLPVPLAKLSPSAKTYTDTTAIAGTKYFWRVGLKLRSSVVVSAEISSQADASFNKVVLLIPGDDSDGLVRDRSSYGRTLTARNGIAVTNDPTGGRSIAFNGSNQALIATHSAELSTLAADWTFEADIYLADLSAYFGIYTKRVADAGPMAEWQAFYDFHTLSKRLSAGVVTEPSAVYVGGAVGSGFPGVAATWIRFCVERAGSTLRVYANGAVAKSTGLTPSVALRSTTANLVIGAAGNDFGAPFKGRMRNIRYTIGAARYNGAYTPPTQPFAQA